MLQKRRDSEKLLILAFWSALPELVTIFLPVSVQGMLLLSYFINKRNKYLFMFRIVFGSLSETCYYRS